MAISAIRSVSIPSWINKENAFAAFSGLYINYFWEALIKYDNKVNQNPISTVSRGSWVTFLVNYNLFASFSQIESTLSPERVTPYAWGFFPNPRRRHFYVALLLTVLNTVEIKANQPVPVKGKNNPSQAPAHVPMRMDNFVVVVWKATPYLMIITNIAVTIFQILQGDSSALPKLALIGITLIDITIREQVEYRKHLDKILGYPITAAAFYYGDAGDRLSIIFRLALRQKVVEQKIEEICVELLIKLLVILKPELPAQLLTQLLALLPPKDLAKFQAQCPELFDNAEEN